MMFELPLLEINLLKLLINSVVLKLGTVRKCPSLLMLSYHSAPALKVFALSKYMMLEFSLLEINLLKLLINSAVLKLGTVDLFSSISR